MANLDFGGVTFPVTKENISESEKCSEVGGSRKLTSAKLINSCHQIAFQLVFGICPCGFLVAFNE